MDINQIRDRINKFERSTGERVGVIYVKPKYAKYLNTLGIKVLMDKSLSDEEFTLAMKEITKPKIKKDPFEKPIIQ